MEFIPSTRPTTKTLLSSMVKNHRAQAKTLLPSVVKTNRAPANGFIMPFSGLPNSAIF